MQPAAESRPVPTRTSSGMCALRDRSRAGRRWRFREGRAAGSVVGDTKRDREVGRRLGLRLRLRSVVRASRSDAAVGRPGPATIDELALAFVQESGSRRCCEGARPILESLWLEASNGSTATQRRDVVWPAGYRARFTPSLEILDENGK